MKTSNLLLFAVVFVVVGEMLVRIDHKYDLLDNAPQVIAIEVAESEEKSAVDQGDFVFDESKVRVLVVGDSYINGGGIDPDRKFSNVLRSRLSDKRIAGEEGIVLDVSRPSNNTLDNFNSFCHYHASFKPHVVVWAYNNNDVLGGLEVKDKQAGVAQSENGGSSVPPSQAVNEKSFRRASLDYVYKSCKSLGFVSAKLQTELRVNGIVLPWGDFHYLIQEAYDSDNVNWKLSKEMLVQVAQTCQKGQTAFILYRMPEFNMLDNNVLFASIDDAFSEFVKEQPGITYLHGDEDFVGSDSDKYVLSKYDGHPNEEAHERIADRIVKEMIELRRSQESGIP